MDHKNNTHEYENYLEIATQHVIVAFSTWIHLFGNEESIGNMLSMTPANVETPIISSTLWLCA